MRSLLTFGLLFATTAAYAATPWQVDTAKSHLTFTGSQAGSPFTGEFSKFTIQIDFDPAHPETGHILITIDMASATITDDKEQNDALPTEDWFYPAKFPSAVFEAKTIRPSGANAYVASGTLTLHGITQRVELPFTLKPEGDATRAEGTTTLQRNQFQLGGTQWKDDKWIAYPVTVKFSLLATRQ